MLIACKKVNQVNLGETLLAFHNFILSGVFWLVGAHDGHHRSERNLGLRVSPESGESQGTSAGLTGCFFNPYRPVFGRGSLDRSSHSVFFGGLSTIMVERSTLPPWGAGGELVASSWGLTGTFIALPACRWSLGEDNHLPLFRSYFLVKKWLSVLSRYDGNEEIWWWKVSGVMMDRSSNDNGKWGVNRAW